MLSFSCKVNKPHRQATLLSFLHSLEGEGPPSGRSRIKTK